jgi:predicted ATPase
LGKILSDPDTRLITIVGPGGMGKTRLSLATAEKALETSQFPDGIFFVDLVPLEEVGQIHLAVVEALQIQLSDGKVGTPQQQLLDFLGDKRMLFILDNFDHLLEGAQLVSEILQIAPGVKVLATSREHLHLRLERLFPIHGLEFPDWEAPEDAAEYTAAQLFLDSARRIQPDFELVEDDLAHLSRICRLVSGIPLALELAAGWVEMLPLVEIAAEIQRSLDFLETDMQDIPDRHRSMQAIFESTWERLGPSEREIMEKLSVFRSGFTREAAGQVAAPQEEISVTLRLLARLVSKSLLHVDPARVRYQIHKLLRKCTLERLEHTGELDDTRKAHADYFLELLYRREADIKGGQDQKAALDEIEADFANIQAAWEWTLTLGDLEMLDRSLEALFWFCRIRNRTIEGVELHLHAEAQFAPGLDRISNTIWRRIAARRISLDQFAWVGDFESKLNEIGGILAIARQEGELAEVAFALETFGWLQWDIDMAAAIQILEESQSIYHSLGDTFSALQVMGWISWLYLETGHLEKRVEIIRQQLEMARKSGDRLTAADAQGVIGFVSERDGRYSEAGAKYHQVLPVFREYGDRWHTCEYLIRLGELAFLKGDFSQARQMIADGQVLARQFNIRNPYIFALSTLSMLHNAEEQYERGLETCQELTVSLPREAILILRGMVYALCGLDDFVTAQVNLAKALEMTVSIEATGWKVQCLPAAALISNTEDQQERAAEMLALAYHHPAAATGWLDVFPLVTRLRARLEEELPTETFAAAWERGKTLDLDTTISNLLSEYQIDATE